MTTCWRPKQNDRYFAATFFKCILLKGNVCILIQLSLKFVTRVQSAKIRHKFEC